MKNFKRYLTALVTLFFVYQSTAGVGESAVITLVFPPGARATGLGEAFVGIADDINATFFNPAGLGQPPLSNTWLSQLQKSDYVFTAIASKRKKAFDLHDEVWVGTNKGLLFYNGKSWESHTTYLIEEGDNLESIAESYLDFDDDDALDRAILTLRKTNDIGMKHFNGCYEVLEAEVAAEYKTTEEIEDLSFQLTRLSGLDLTEAKVYGIIASKVDSSRADTVASKLLSVLESNDTDFEDLIELKIPFTIAVDDSVTTLEIDKADQLWIGTSRGLWRHDGSSWKWITVVDGLPSDNIISFAASGLSMLAAGTDNGLAIQEEGIWTAYTTEDGLPESKITALTFGKDKDLYIGTENGLLKKSGDTWELYDTSDGLLTNNVSSLMYDSDGRLWVGGKNGVTIYNEVSWKRYKFPDSYVYDIKEVRSGRVWISTDRGVIRYKAGRVSVKDGKTVEDPPQWKAYHSKNALKGNDARGIAVHGRDIWIITDEAINKYDKAERQGLMFYEPLLPAFQLDDLWHLYWSFIYPTEDWGTIGFTINFINMGVNSWTDELGQELGNVRSWEGIFGINYGLGITEDFSLGLNVKYVQSNLAPGIGKGDEGIGRTFAIDFSLLKRDLFIKNLDLGLIFQNMGPPIFYISRDQSDPIPFTLMLGLAYDIISTPIHDLTFALDMQREFVKNYIDKDPDPFYKALITSIADDGFKTEMQEINFKGGFEYWYVNFLALRTGFLFDYIGERYEWTFGLGVKYGNLNVDWSYIYSKRGFMKDFLQRFNSTKTGATGARDGQWRISLIGRF